MLRLIRDTCPFPTSDDAGKRQPGYLLSLPPICRSCRTSCWSSLPDGSRGQGPHHYVCPKGMSLVMLPFPDGQLLVCGILVPEANTACTSQVRRQNRSQKASWPVILAWYKAAMTTPPCVERVAEQRVREAIEGLHDIKTAVSLVTRNAEAVVSQYPGDTDDDKIESAPPPIKSLLKSVGLLHGRLTASSIIANPAAAAYGQKHPTPVYRLFHRMVRLFEEEAARKHIAVRMAGSSYSRPKCYDSFEVIPLVLIHNAVKYSVDGQEIVVRVDDVRAAAVRVEVSSYGPVVPKEMRESIFQKGVRTPEAISFAGSGSGLGLYIADIIARAHNFRIEYDSMPPDPRNHGLNVFRFVAE